MIIITTNTFHVVLISLSRILTVIFKGPPLRSPDLKKNVLNLFFFFYDELPKHLVLFCLPKPHVVIVVITLQSFVNNRIIYCT